MQMTRLAAAALAVACLGWSQAKAQDQQDRARAFVNSVSFTSSSNALARWDGRICVGAVGLATDQAQALVDRVSARAQQVGLRPGEPGCTANVMVIYAPDSDRLSREIIDQRRDLLGYVSEDGRQNAGREAMEDFANQPRPIRWWHVSSTGRGSLRPTDGLTFQSTSQTTAQGAASGGGGGVPSSSGDSALDIQGTEAVRSNGSRTRVQVRPNDLSYVLVVVDARRVAGVPANAWMDYVAFVALAQIDARARTEEYSTVLNTFNSGATATGMTAWDEAYLAGLYDARTEVANRQAASISRRLASVQ